MKRAIGWIVSWALFWLGHGVSRLFRLKLVDRLDQLHPYPLYCWFMGTSLDVQDWAGNDGPWKRPAPRDRQPEC
jgi:hypothetical protein